MLHQRPNAAPTNVTENSIASHDWIWPNFTRIEMACRHCGIGYPWPEFMDRLQSMRDRVGRPLRITSAHRCPLHNARVGGAPFSQHLRLAADISTVGHDRAKLHEAAKRAGFTGFGFYLTFLHIDLGAPREWYAGPKARDLWQIL
ncbi:D-Ala-D-Ala carboxypeptidase family metallohydrolase [Litorimonas sp. RW-G-Af-16]|uniref:D-Ala-D-Ala carboxypeptidase family metallohydrolase n=1 Tax=Litorimonas sp. RW-G-Af-16 TaxID=3241168 RepID=UPI00390CAA27